LALIFTLACIPVTVAVAEDGYDLWLRYRPLTVDYRDANRAHVTAFIAPERKSDTLQIAIAELRRGVGGLFASEFAESPNIVDGAILLGTPADLSRYPSLNLPMIEENEGYRILSARADGNRVTVVIANNDVGVLYGVYALLGMAQTGQSLGQIDVDSAPRVHRRLLNHWDNLDRTVERGYAGSSIWDWWRLPDYIDPRYEDYARANASIGINGTVLNNVNAKSESLTIRYLEKAAALADVFRPYGIRVYLSARFNAPIELGGLDTADPLDPDVMAWWRVKVDEIYALIPDFGGFLVKANSEGQPGPQDYGRNHADGANMLAAAVLPHGGIVMWRAFVYDDGVPQDRAKQAYDQFKPLDGSFADNVIVQVKNGAIDFQPREPFHPLLGAMPDTPLMLEFQVTKEYLGFSTHLVYLGSLFEETLQSDTFVQGSGSTVAKVVDGSLQQQSLTGMAGVANIGTDRSWSGSHFDQANWYAFGRLAWNPDAGARDIADDWVRMTFASDEEFVEPVVDMMMRSHQVAVDYMTPLGLNHLMGSGHHYGPAPWVDDLGRADWNPVYFHRADELGIGFDRSRSGSNAVAQYAAPIAKRFGHIDSTPDEFLLWFHHVGWDYRMPSGRTLWDELVITYAEGAEAVVDMQQRWSALAGYIDDERFDDVATFLGIQANEARWWRDACIAYFQTFANRPLPDQLAQPARSLDWYRSLHFPYAPGR
jgi:alpha-glucuronidase